MNYWDFIEEQRQLIQLGKLEEHHIYPKFDRQTEEVIYLSLNAHADASVYQSEEWGWGCFHQRLLPHVSPELEERARYWCGDGLRTWHRENPEVAKEVCSRAGTISNQVQRKRNPELYVQQKRNAGSKGFKKQREVLGEEGTRQMCSNGGKSGSKTTNSQRYKCKTSGFVSTAAGVVSYQKGQGYDTSKYNREKL